MTTVSKRRVASLRKELRERDRDEIRTDKKGSTLMHLSPGTRNAVAAQFLQERALNPLGSVKVARRIAGLDVAKTQGWGNITDRQVRLCIEGMATNPRGFKRGKKWKRESGMWSSS
jgi:hypothetical protein